MYLEQQIQRGQKADRHYVKHINKMEEKECWEN